MTNLLAKVPYWETLISTMRETDGHSLAVGDFNTCRPYLHEAGAIDPAGGALVNPLGVTI